jgi:hypothetical protein
MKNVLWFEFLITSKQGDNPRSFLLEHDDVGDMEIHDAIRQTLIGTFFSQLIINPKVTNSSETMCQDPLDS